MITRLESSFRLYPVAISLDEGYEARNSLCFGNVALHALLILVDAYFARCSTHIAIVGISHFTGTIHYAAHNADFKVR